MSETIIICEGCGNHNVSKNYCEHFGAGIRAMGCSAFKAVEPCKPKFRDIPIESKAGRLWAGNTRIDVWPSLAGFVGFRYADGGIRPFPTRLVGYRCLRAIAVVVEE